MRTVLAKRDDRRPQPPPPAGVGLPPAHVDNPKFEQGLQGWHGLGDTFATFRGDNGRFRRTTFTPEKGAAAMGALFQDFTVHPNTKALRFLVMAIVDGKTGPRGFIGVTGFEFLQSAC